MLINSTSSLQPPQAHPAATAGLARNGAQGQLKAFVLAEAGVSRSADKH